MVAARRQDLEVAEAEERRRHAAHHRAGLGLRTAVVEHVADHVLAGRDERERARRRHAQMVHGLAAEKLAHRRAHHGAAVGRPRVRRRPRAFELQLPALAARVDHFAERDGAAVAELTGPGAELMPAVAGGERQPCPEARRLPREHLRELCALARCRREAEQLRDLARVREQARARDRRRHHPRVAGAEHLAPLVARLGVTRELAHEAVVESQVL